MESQPREEEKGIMTCAWERLIVESMPAGVCISWSGFQHGGVVNWLSCVNVQRSECIEAEGIRKRRRILFYQLKRKKVFFYLSKIQC